MKANRLFFAVLACLATPVVASAVDYNTSAATISCNTLIGTISSKPVLTMEAQPNTVLTIKGTLGGCTVSGALPADPPLYVLSGKMKAKVTVTTDASCISLVSGFQVAESFAFTWKTATGQKLDFPSTTFTVDSSGLIASLAPFGSGTYGVFTATGTLSSDSAFTGATTPGFVFMSGEDVFNMLGQCCTDPVSCTPVGKGIKKLHFGIGQIQM
jgi:hypothetical protein